MSQEKTKKCPYCAEEINAEAIVCKHCNKELDKNKVKQAQYKWTGGKIGCAVIFVFIVVVMAVSCSSTSTNNTATPKAVTARQAEIISQSFIKPLLKSPSSADFPTYDYSAYNLEGGKWKIISYVDAQNSFGAQIRTDYSVILTHNGGDWAASSNWALNGLVFDGEVILEDTSVAN